MSTSSGPTSESDNTLHRAQSQSRRRIVAWDPGSDTLIALGTLLAFWGCYWAGSNVNGWFLLVGVVIVGTLVPALTVWGHRREGLEGLGIRRKYLILSLVISAVLAVGSGFQLFSLAASEGVPVLPHVLANLLVFWEPFFIFGWLFLRWERAFGWLPAIVLTGFGFTLQHIGSVPFAAALGFGVFAIMFGIVFVFVRNLAILWPLFYPVASGIGTLQAGVVMDWSTVISGAVLLAVQFAVLALVWWRVQKSVFSSSMPRIAS